VPTESYGNFGLAGAQCDLEGARGQDEDRGEQVAAQHHKAQRAPRRARRRSERLDGRHRPGQAVCRGGLGGSLRAADGDHGRVRGVLAGAGYLPAAAIAAAHILTAHLALRPVAQRVDRLPASPDSEVETTYEFRAVTRAADEAHIRTLLVRELTRDDFVLHSVQSHDLNSGSGLVEVSAELERRGRDGVALEAAVSRLSLEPSISSVSWTTREPTPLAVLDEETSS
jgi:hypothetical protein